MENVRQKQTEGKQRQRVKLTVKMIETVYLKLSMLLVVTLQTSLSLIICIIFIMSSDCIKTNKTTRLSIVFITHIQSV